MASCSAAGMGQGELLPTTAAQGTQGGSAGAACAPAPRLAGGRRGPRERIDIDTNIARARAEMKAAQRAVAKARAASKQEKRKKTRLLKKASNLSASDLERIAVLKRTGLWDPTLTAPPQPGAASAGGSSSSATGSCTAIALPAPMTADIKSGVPTASCEQDLTEGDDQESQMHDVDDEDCP